MHCSKFAVALLVLALSACKRDSGTQVDEKLARDSIFQVFETKLQHDLDIDKLSGSISIAITKDNHLIWSKALGYADPVAKTAADTTTIFRAGSISKSLTALLMLQLAEEGKLNISDPVERYLPEIKTLKGKDEKHPITLLQLATHTSGLAREPELDGAVTGPVLEWESKLLKCIPTTTVDTIPGTRFSYSNIGYGILGLVLSRAADKPYIDLVEEKILKPLHMDHSFYVVHEATARSIATGMAGAAGDSIDIEQPRQDFMGRGYKVPNGGLFCTASDLSRFVRCLAGYSDIIKRSSLNEMEHPHPPANGYGLGVSVTEEEGMYVVSHSGSVPGYTAVAGLDRNSGYGVVLMRNYNGGATNLDEAMYVLLLSLGRVSKQ